MLVTVLITVGTGSHAALATGPTGTGCEVGPVGDGALAWLGVLAWLGALAWLGRTGRAVGQPLHGAS